jgi:gas vesicle protein
MEKATFEVSPKGEAKETKPGAAKAKLASEKEVTRDMKDMGLTPLITERDYAAKRKHIGDWTPKNTYGDVKGARGTGGTTVSLAKAVYEYINKAEKGRSEPVKPKYTDLSAFERAESERRYRASLEGRQINMLPQTAEEASKKYPVTYLTGDKPRSKKIPNPLAPENRSDKLQALEDKRQDALKELQSESLPKGEQKTATKTANKAYTPPSRKEQKEAADKRRAASQAKWRERNPGKPDPASFANMEKAVYAYLHMEKGALGAVGKLVTGAAKGAAKVGGALAGGAIGGAEALLGRPKELDSSGKETGRRVGQSRFGKLTDFGETSSESRLGQTSRQTPQMNLEKWQPKHKVSTARNRKAREGYLNIGHHSGRQNFAHGVVEQMEKQAPEWTTPQTETPLHKFLDHSKRNQT